LRKINCQDKKLERENSMYKANLEQLERIGELSEIIEELELFPHE